MARTVRIHVSGKVQGVFYRESTRKAAERFGVRGTVRNLDDGRVLVEAEGTDPAVDALIEWCRTGPPAAEVKDVQVQELEHRAFEGFKIER